MEYDGIWYDMHSHASIWKGGKFPIAAQDSWPPEEKLQAFAWSGPCGLEAVRSTFPNLFVICFAKNWGCFPRVCIESWTPAAPAVSPYISMLTWLTWMVWRISEIRPRCQAAFEDPNSKVLVHCVLGVNRSATIIVAWLLETRCGMGSWKAKDSWWNVCETFVKMGEHMWFDVWNWW